MTDLKIEATTTVILTIEIPTIGSYGPEWTIEDLHKQAIREAKDSVKNKMTHVRIVGEPRIKICTFEVGT